MLLHSGVQHTEKKPEAHDKFSIAQQQLINRLSSNLMECLRDAIAISNANFALIAEGPARTVSTDWRTGCGNLLQEHGHGGGVGELESFGIDSAGDGVSAIDLTRSLYPRASSALIARRETQST